MYTEQNYVGKGDSANDFEQLANTNPSAADNQTNQLQSVEVNRQVYEAQAKQLALVKDFISCHGAASPIEAINHLLFCWLDRPETNLVLDANRNQLFRAQQLINFLAELAESAAKLAHLNNTNTK